MKPTSASTIVTTNTTMPRCRAACMFTRLSWQTWLAHGCLNDERVRPNSTASATESIVRSATTTHTIIRQLGLATSCGGLSSVGAGRWRLDTTVYRGHSPRMLRPLATTVCEACYRALRHSGEGVMLPIITNVWKPRMRTTHATKISGAYDRTGTNRAVIDDAFSSSGIWTTCCSRGRNDNVLSLFVAPLRVGAVGL